MPILVDISFLKFLFAFEFFFIISCEYQVSQDKVYKNKNPPNVLCLVKPKDCEFYWCIGNGQLCFT